MLSSTNSTKRSFFGAFGPAAGVAVFCMALGTGAYAQDECSSAATAVVGANAFSTATATASTDAVSDAQCADTYLNWLATQQDVWFVFNPGTLGTANFSTCLAGSYDTSMVIYSGSSCGTKSQIACNGDDDADASCQNFHSEINGLLIDGTSNYYIRLGGYEGATGSGTLTVAFTPVSFASCIGNTHPCDEVGGTGGCDNLTCCETVCGFDASCCDTTWSQGCIDLAVSECGLFIYNCPAGAGAPANNCAANATVVAASSTVAYDTTNATTDGPNEPDCNSGNNDLPIWKDVWYRFTAQANGFATASNCNTGTFDSKIAFYDVGDWSQFNPQLLPDYFMACNEDCDGDPLFNSSQTVAVAVGRTYLVRLGGYEGASGSGNISFTLPDPCTLPSASGSEVEPCGDNTNGGCADDDTTVITTDLPLDTAISGTFWADGDIRDLDVYKVVITSGSQCTFKLWSPSNTVMQLWSGDPCTGVVVLANGSQTACPQTLEYCLNAGTYYLVVGIDGFSGTPCGSGSFNNYVVKVETAPSACPVTIDTVCDDPGPSDLTANLDSTNVPNGMVQCGVAGPTGYSVDSAICRSFSAADTDAGQINCVKFGVAVFHYNSATTIDLNSPPLSGRLGLYRDTNGGNPTNWEGANADLVLIDEFPFSAPAGFYVGTISLDEPICMDGATQNLVVVMHMDATVNGSGNRIAGAGNAVGPFNNTGVIFPACGAAYTDFNFAVGGLNTNRTWVCVINGDFSTCGAACVYDIAGNDLVVNGADLGALLANWGNPGTGDFDGSGAVNGADLGELLANWGACPN